MKLYHTTTRANALSIMRNGFEDRAGHFGTESEWRGVWLSDSPQGPNDGVDGDTVLRVELSADQGELAQWEWVEKGKGNREWLVPAAFVSERGSISIAPAED